jgi:oligogalacturonide transport system substrate-binding protein
MEKRLRLISGGLIAVVFSITFLFGANTKQVTMRFSWWDGGARHKATLEAINPYQKNNPNVKIRAEYMGYDGYREKLFVQLSGNSEPDIMQVDFPWVVDIASQGDKFVDFSKEANIDLKQFSKNFLWEFGAANGKLLGLPTGANGFGLVINKKFFQKNNIPLTTEWNRDTLNDISEKIHQKDRGSYLLIASSISTVQYFFTKYFRSKNGKYWATDDYKLTCTNAELIDAFKQLKKNYASGVAVPLGEASLFEAKDTAVQYIYHKSS